jgi:hypothetical protein
MLCNYAECRVLFIIILNVIMLRVMMLSGIMLSIIIINSIMLSVIMLSHYSECHFAECRSAVTIVYKIVSLSKQGSLFIVCLCSLHNLTQLFVFDLALIS